MENFSVKYPSQLGGDVDTWQYGHRFVFAIRFDPEVEPMLSRVTHTALKTETQTHCYRQSACILCVDCFVVLVHRTAVDNTLKYVAILEQK